jgi:hypothetical protein
VRVDVLDAYPFFDCPYKRRWEEDWKFPRVSRVVMDIRTRCKQPVLMIITVTHVVEFRFELRAASCQSLLFFIPLTPLLVVLEKRHAWL